jgi:predicted nucleic acid-binding protein
LDPFEGVRATFQRIQNTWKALGVIRKPVFDTGPLVALLKDDDANHEWMLAQSKQIVPPAQTCEAVITESVFLLHRAGVAADGIFRLIEQGSLEVTLAACSHHSDIRALLNRYRNIPMSFADACIVRMSELDSAATVMTFDSDFRIYRKHGNKVIPVLMPE